ncbi:MAG: hypothetical protein ACJZ12_02795 [Candidatus Neomarinimicrobiota bacterium]
MNFFFIFYLLSGIIFSQSKIFSTIDGSVEEIIYSSSFWLSGSPAIDPTTENRFIIQSGISSVLIVDNKNIFKYPNLNIGLKVSKNLSLICRSYGFRSGDYSPHILGGGIQYYYGGRDTLSWSTSLQRNDLKGLKNFSLTSLKIDLQKWLLWNNYKFCVGLGSNFFKQSSVGEYSDFPKSMKGQINYICFRMMVPISIFSLGIDSQIALRQKMVTLYLQKEFF